MNSSETVSGTELYVHLNPGIAAQLQRISPSLTSTEDVHICGGCKQSFPDINLFVEHKHAGCGVSSQHPLPIMGISLDQSTLNYITSGRDNSVSNTASQYLRVILNGSNVPLHLQNAPCEQESLLVTPYKKAAVVTSSEHSLTVESCSAQNSVIQLPKKGQESKQVERTKPLSTDETASVAVDETVPVNATEISCHEQDTLLNLNIEENSFRVQEKETTVLENIEIPQSNCEIIIPSDSLDVSDESSKSYKNNSVGSTSKFLCQSDTTCITQSDHKELEQEGTIIIHNDQEVVLVEDYQTFSENNVNSTSDSSPVYSDRTKKKHACPVVNCKFTTPYPKDMVRHMRKHTGERPYQCESCKRTYSRIDKLRAHQHIHFGEKCHKCQVCDYATVDKGSLKKHMRIHNDERPFKCQICPYRSKRSCHLTVHLRTHTGDHPFVCIYESCMSAFKTSSDLKRHIRMHTGERPYACDICDYRCSIKSNLGVHIRINHSTENLIPCTICNHVSVSEGAAREHEKSHSDSNPAASTALPQKKDITTRKNLGGNVRSHIRKKNSNAKSHKKLKGKDGGKVTGSERTRCSSAVKPYCVKAHKCTLCDAAFVREDSWRSHMRQHQNQGAYMGTINDSEILASVHSIAEDNGKTIPLESNLVVSRNSTVEPKQTLAAVSVIESSIEGSEVTLTTDGMITADNGVLVGSNVLGTNESSNTNFQHAKDSCNLSLTSDLQDKANKNQSVEEVDMNSVLGTDTLQTQPVFLYVQNGTLVEETTVVEGFHNSQFF